MAWPGAAGARAACVRQSLEIFAESAPGRAGKTAELDYDHQPAPGHLAGELSVLGYGPRLGHGTERRRPGASARGVAGSVAAAAQQRRGIRYSLLPDQPAGAGHRAQMGAPSAPGVARLAPSADRLQGIDALSGGRCGMARALR